MRKLTAATTVVTLGLLWLRPFQRWLFQKHLRPVWDNYTKIRVIHRCMQTLAPLSQKQFLFRGVPLGPPPAQWEVIRTDACLLWWGGVWHRRGVNGTWKGALHTVHIHFLELTAVFLTVLHFQSVLRGKRVLVHTDNRVTFFYNNHQGGTRSQSALQVACNCLSGSDQPTFIPDSVFTRPT